MNALEQLIRAEVTPRGPMRFDRFMELALYHPEHGYYAVPREIGRAGDFITSVSVGPLYGRFLAWQARQMAELLGEPVFWIVEQGAHDGRLARDILDASRSIPQFFGALRYLIIEPSRALRETQKRMLAGFEERVSWVDDVGSWTGDKPNGLFLSNELVDAMPVRLIERGAQDWKERCVVAKLEDGLAWQAVEIEDEDLLAAMADLPLSSMPGARTEINLSARKWMRGVADFLGRGYVLTIDYGFPAAVYYARHEGTLTCYHEHRRDNDILRTPGGQDITAHVDFSALARAGERAGLQTLALVDQGRFLTGILQGLVAAAQDPFADGGSAQAFRMLTHPEHLGTRFQVLVQARNAPDKLDGLAFARRGGFD